MRAFVKELLARDLVILVDGIDRHFFQRDALAGGFGRDVEREADRELPRRRAVEEWASHGLAVERLVRNPIFALLDDRLLAVGLFAGAFDRDAVGRVHR